MREKNRALSLFELTGTRQPNNVVERELLPSATLLENQEFETDAPSGHRSTAALCIDNITIVEKICL